MSYSDGSEAPKTEGGLPARLFYNDITPPKAEDAGKDACTTPSIQPLYIASSFGLIPFPYPPLSSPETSGCLNLASESSRLFQRVFHRA